MSEKILMKGNEALAEGAVRAGCRFFAGYPITPQNEVPEYMSWRIPQEGGTFIQAESEVAAINMLYGAAATGTRCMTSSSSPGISLKQEGISYVAGADLPIFYANVMRGGPGLGNIAAGQGDYNQSTRGGGHGDYRVIVLAPNSVEEMGNFPRLAYELAEKYRVPTMILADAILGQMMEPVEFKFDPVDPAKLPGKEWALGDATGREKRVVRSYDLREGKLEIMNEKRIARYRRIAENETRFEERDTDGARLVIVAYGTSSRIAAGAAKAARERGMKVGLFRPITLWPFPQKRLGELAGSGVRFLVVEMSMGQLVDDVRLAVCGKAPVDLYGRSSGVPSAEEVLAQIEKAYAASQAMSAAVPSARLAPSPAPRKKKIAARAKPAKKRSVKKLIKKAARKMVKKAAKKAAKKTVKKAIPKPIQKKAARKPAAKKAIRKPGKKAQIPPKRGRPARRRGGRK